MVVDASALVAILADEPDGPEHEERLLTSEDRTIPFSGVFEAVLALSRRKGRPPEEMQTLVSAYLRTGQIEIAALGEAETVLAIEAHARFGKGRHPARLNMGDCFAYACAKARGAPLLYKGDDFVLTDVERA
ncbi:MAG TPA: type II toxin-antitoxin system VapC family toxin [Caulobacteraceae bacterium]|nr:type II toxin-antitoxin system VapC family toxin [Caulobacteraceae bacterium]